MPYDFTKAFVNQLYAGPAGSGEFYLVLSAGDGQDTIALAAALADARVTFLYSAGPVGITQQNAQAFVDSVLAVLRTAGRDRGFVWLQNVQQIDDSTTAVMGLSLDGSAVQGALTGGEIVRGLNLVVTNGTALQLEGTNLKLEGTIRFEGPSAPTIRSVTTATIPFEGRTRGNIDFSVFIQGTSLNDNLRCGFGFFYPGDVPQTFTSVALPLAEYGIDFPRFYASLNLSDPTNKFIANKSLLTFTGETQRDNQIVPTELSSYYRTTYGEAIVLVPSPGPFGDDRPNAARLQFNSGPVLTSTLEQFHVSPSGDFVLQIGDGTSGKARDLMCGLQGSEFIAFRPKSASFPGDFLRYSASQAAYAPRYPFPISSPTGPPEDPQASLLTEDFRTSWGNLIAGDATAIPYVAQPKGMTLFGHDTVVNPSQPLLLGMMDPSVHLPPAGVKVFPLAPYAGAISGKANLPDFELQILGATRRKVIGEGSNGFSSSRHGALSAVNEDPYNTTTPSGFLVTVDNGKWQKILLGQNLNPVTRQMYFCKPSSELQQAFQTNQLFAVIANSNYLGALKGSGSGDCLTDAAFYNEINIGGWGLRADTGKNRYNDYRSVILIKGMKGALYTLTETESGPTPTGLIMNPAQWTQRDALGAPSDYPPGSTTLNDPDPQELPILSGWLQDYFEAARVHSEPEYFRKFNQIAKDPNWTGVLVLRASIDVPKDLAGIVSGARDRNSFTAHHFAIETTQISNDVGVPLEVKGSSSMFGLIYYQDPAFVMPDDVAAEPQPVPPTAGVDYEFRLLTLKVLFENTSIASFQSWSQLTINKLFDSPVRTVTGGLNNTVILKGTYEDRPGGGSYNLSTDHAVLCYLRDNNIINKIEIVTAQMTTQSDLSSRFGLSGFLDFSVVLDRKGEVFDIFSFGSAYDPIAKKMLDEPRKGLSFASLGIDMIFATDPLQNKYLFNASDVRFDVVRSTPRAQSLFLNLALSLQRLITSNKESPPSSSGFAPLITDATLSGVEGDVWYGLEYQLNMGTPGNLAGAVGLTSGLLTAWAPKSGPSAYSALAGLRLPGTGGGAKLISLQNVLKLSIGQMVLTFDRNKNSFLLMLTEIALRFLGLLKIPPSGSSTFFLFGNPAGDGKPSGLGWYAMYNRLTPKPPAALPAETSDARVE
jgi:hypothetical protein